MKVVRKKVNNGGCIVVITGNLLTKLNSQIMVYSFSNTPTQNTLVLEWDYTHGCTQYKEKMSAIDFLLLLYFLACAFYVMWNLHIIIIIIMFRPLAEGWMQWSSILGVVALV